MPPKKNKGGRPSKYDKIDLAQVEKLARKGWDDIEMAEFFGVDVRTWYRWKGQHEDFCQSLKNWKDNADREIERSLYERAKGFKCIETKVVTHEGKVTDTIDIIKHYPPDTTAQIYWLKNRQPDRWRDKREYEDGDKQPVPVKVEISVKDGKVIKENDDKPGS